MSDPLGDGLTATATERPESPEALRDAVARHSAAGSAMYPQGGRTSLDYGGTPRRPGVAIDTRGLDRIVDYPAADMTITVEAGVTLSALQSTLSAEGQRLPLDAPFPDQATIGGIYATNTSGPRRFGWGRPRDMIIGVTFATADGKLVKGGGRVVKNVAGYDFPKLLTGSLGTLGIISQLTLKVRPRPEAAALVFVPFDDADALESALAALNTSGTRPVALDVLNESAAIQVLPDTYPEHPWTLVLGFEDNAASVAWQVDRALQEVGRGQSDVLIAEGVDADPLWSGLAAFQARDREPVTCVATVRRSAAFSLVRDLDPSNWLVQVHAGSGVVHAHASEDFPLDVLAIEIDRLRARAVGAGGNLTLSRCPADWKPRLRVWGAPRGDWALCELVKRTLDPAGLLNPGRFVGSI